MATTTEQVSLEKPLDKGLKSGALGLVSTTIIATASVAPAYSLAATLALVVGVVALQSPAVAVLAFVPMLLTSIGYSELNKADPDCGTTFTWATRAFGPKTGWAGGWAIVAADVLVMASLAQVAGQYVFFLVGGPNSSIGKNPTSGWVLLTGVLWIVVMTYICYRGIEVSANFQKVLLSIELVMLFVLSIVALVKVYSGHPGSIRPSVSWFNPFNVPNFSAFTGTRPSRSTRKPKTATGPPAGRRSSPPSSCSSPTRWSSRPSRRSPESAPRAPAWATRPTLATCSRSRATPSSAGPASARSSPACCC
jgi:amino acid transporter